MAARISFKVSDEVREVLSRSLQERDLVADARRVDLVPRREMVPPMIDHEQHVVNTRASAMGAYQWSLYLKAADAIEAP